ncbi:hypothetical protein F4810DRAFT_656829 [Camillea tinctor]|nr:hypothetical protein F4810DRAFT_656829 [Camillea tinctor]
MDDFSDSPPPRRPVRSIPPRAAKTKTPVRRTRSTTTAAHLSSPSSPEDDHMNYESNEPPSRVLRTSPRKRSLQNSSPPATPKRRRQKSDTFDSQQPTPVKAPEVDAAEVDATDVDAMDETPNVFPPWQTLPYLAWQRVFEYVADPIRNEASRIEDVTGAVYSLLSAAQTCKATLEPALASLYKCPPFLLHPPNEVKQPLVSFFKFVDTLHLPSDSTIIRYRPRVEILRINADKLLYRRFNKRQMCLKELARNLPRLSHLELYHPDDEPPYRELDKHIRQGFTKEDLFEAFEPVPNGDILLGDKTAVTRLQSWRWNSRLVPAACNIENLAQIHLHPSFASLRKVAYVNYQLPSWGLSPRVRDSPQMRERDQLAGAQLADSITALPNLEHLILESSTLANGSLLGHLPKTLKHLELINCWEIISEDLALFLATHGSSLQKLTIKHCQSLSLGFLPVLGVSCPCLTHLEVDLSYFQHHASYHDNKPEYASLLEEDQVPTWPASMQSITIINMRNWSLEAAQMFFQSLLDNARELPHLRRLEFKVLLNIAWRERKELRKSLVGKMTRVFGKRTQPPKEFKTLRPVKTPRKSIANPKRRSPRIADQRSELNSSEDTIPAFNGRELSRILSIGKNLRKLRLRRAPFDADDEDSEDELAVGHTNNTRSLRNQQRANQYSDSEDEFIQGLCEIVDIQIDNQRPSEWQREMADFIDSPNESGTESDWDGIDE